MKKPSEIKIFALGGLGVVGMNMYCIEMNDEIIVMDAGILFTEGDAPGVDYVIPDFTYLIENNAKIKAMFITHGHEDHIGALPFLLAKVKIPVIYTSGIAYNLIKNKMYEFPNILYNLEHFYDDSVFKYQNFEISFFRTNHSIPDSFGIAIKTKYGYVVNTGDFKFDLTPVGKPSDFYKMTALGEAGVLCLLADSTNADIPTLSLSEKQIASNIKSTFRNIKGRIIVATFASNVFRVKHILEACEECGRYVAIFGHSMEKNIEAAIRLKYIKLNRDIIISQRDINNIEPEKLTILCTGSQGEPLAALSRIARGTHKQIKLLPNDTIIYSSKPIPGNEQFINRNINMLVKNGATVIRNTPLTDTHTTGHASQAEMRLMLSFMKPKYFMPVHGEYNMLKRHAKIATELGVPSKNCFCLANGDVLHLTKDNAYVKEKEINCDDIYLDNTLSDVNSSILKERKHLGDEGLITLIFTINKQKELIIPTRMETIGFIATAENKELINSIKMQANHLLAKHLKQHKMINIKELRNEISIELANHIYEMIERRPFIITYINLI